MDIVDSQIHAGPGGAAEIVAAMDAVGIASVMIDERWPGAARIPSYDVGNNVLRTSYPSAELAAWAYPGRFAYLARVDPRDPELRAIIRIVRDSTYGRALRIIPGMTRATLAEFAAGSYDAVFAEATDCGLPIFVQISGNTDLLARYLEKFPDCRAIICHTGMPPGRELVPFIADLEGLPDSHAYWKAVGDEPKPQAWEKVLRIADWPNVALKWAHAPSMFDAPGYPNEGLRPYLRKALDVFGAERVMWGSDITANKTGESWAELVFAVRNNPDLSDEDKEWVLGRTARKWLDWPN